ncbi:MAG: SLBB domain-containing protein [Propionibacteriaceae bacterium]|nr:SLBB domain-containing protein [Propionibacteriaceae bacterium]
MSLAQQVFDAGVVGDGGAGFPTYKKLVTGPELLIIDAAECEPLLGSDKYLMRSSPADVVAGIEAVAAACQIPRAVIGIKAHYAREIAALEAAATRASLPIAFHRLDSFYPAGDEQILIFEVTGRTVPPGGLPADVGVLNMNVTTTANVARATRGEPVTRRYVTVTGAVAAPTIVDAPVGTTAADLIAAAGGVTTPEYVIVRGGPMMGKHHAAREAATLGYGKADGGLIVLSASHPLVQFMAKPVDRVLAETQSMCIQCRACTDLCPRYLIGHQLRPHRVMRAMQNGADEALADALLCCECGICELYACPMGLSPRQMNVLVKAQLRAAGASIADRSVHTGQTAERAYRRLPQSRLIERLGLTAYPTTIESLVRLDPETVRLPTRHGVGVAGRPCVAAGDQVSVGQVVAEVSPGEMGALVHASLTGRVTDVAPDHITIRREGGR